MAALVAGGSKVTPAQYPSRAARFRALMPTAACRRAAASQRP